MSEKKILTVYGERVSEKTIEKSRFVTYSARVESEEEARVFLARVRSEHSLATHVCYAFVADKLGNLCRFSDDGEPQGTAGLPILEVIKNKGLFETAVAVVRYFGGVKLGAGGLVRAYSSSASENLAEATIKSAEMCSELSVFVDYSLADAVRKYFSLNACSFLGGEYGANVKFTVAVKKTDEAAFVDGLFDYLQGKAEIKKEGEYFALTDL